MDQSNESQARWKIESRVPIDRFGLCAVPLSTVEVCRLFETQGSIGVTFSMNALKKSALRAWTGWELRVDRQTISGRGS